MVFNIILFPIESEFSLRHHPSLHFNSHSQQESVNHLRVSGYGWRSFVRVVSVNVILASCFVSLKKSGYMFNLIVYSHKNILLRERERGERDKGERLRDSPPPPRRPRGERDRLRQ